MKYRPDSIIHFAAESHVDRSIVNPLEFINTNIIGTVNLLIASKKVFKNNNKFSTPEKKLNTIINNIQDSTADLLIFGENNFPYLLDKLDLKILKESLKENQVLIIGATRFENDKYYNSLINITPSKVIYFDKKILVPFGEFLPLRDSLNFLERIVGPNNFSSGNEQRLINLSNNLSSTLVILLDRSVQNLYREKHRRSIHNTIKVRENTSTVLSNKFSIKKR